MQELSQAIDRAIESGGLCLRDSAKKWAAFSLDNYTGEMLSAALNISKALAEFDCLIEQRKP